MATGLRRGTLDCIWELKLYRGNWGRRNSFLIGEGQKKKRKKKYGWSVRSDGVMKDRKMGSETRGFFFSLACGRNYGQILVGHVEYMNEMVEVLVSKHRCVCVWGGQAIGRRVGVFVRDLRSNGAYGNAIQRAL